MRPCEIDVQSKADGLTSPRRAGLQCKNELLKQASWEPMARLDPHPWLRLRQRLAELDLIRYHSIMPIGTSPTLSAYK